MTGKTLPAVVLVVAVTALVGSVGWAVAGAHDGSAGWMMSRYGNGMMGLASSGGNGQRVESLAAARTQAQRFADRLDLNVGEVMRFSRNYYAELSEPNGRLATEVLVDPTSGAVWLEYGPAMMWNSRYGMVSDFRLRGAGGMGGGGMMAGTGSGSGMMGGGGMMAGGSMMGGAAGAAPTSAGSSAVSPAAARSAAQRWLDSNVRGTEAGDAEAFPGYYTLHAMRAGKVTGMLSVNAVTGSVWFHWWHGRFVSMSA